MSTSRIIAESAISLIVLSLPTAYMLLLSGDAVTLENAHVFMMISLTLF